MYYFPHQRYNFVSENLQWRRLREGLLGVHLELRICSRSDTTASVLCNIFYYLLGNPSSYWRLASEIHQADTGYQDQARLAKLPYLNTVINETMRIQTVIPNGVQRVLDPKSHGVSLCGSSFQDSFIPKRWLHGDEPILSHPEFCLDLEAYSPWSIDKSNLSLISFGSTACAGKHLALMELRASVCALMLNFHLEFEKGWKGSKWVDSLKDRYILVHESSLLVKGRVRS
ncbi:cytochrome P450 [Mycena floridula]|nr:cytochrome P450 [Mycena floridula]